jgi:PAS domain S-box-containing protein
MTEAELRARVSALEAEVACLRAAESLPYRAVVEDMSELVVRWRPDGTRLFVNDAYCRLFDAKREELIGTSFWPLITDDDRLEVRARIACLSPERPVSSGRHRAHGTGGNVIWMEWVDRAIYDERGDIIELQSVGRDVTDRVHFEDQARRIARGDAAARASSAIAHDLRNVLQIIHGLTTLMALESANSANVDTLDEALSAGKRLLSQLSNVSHGVVIEPRPIDLGERVTSLKGLLNEVARRSVRLEERLHPGPCRIVGDPTQIDQILLNLVRNAVDAMPNGGHVLIETRVARVSELLESHRPPGASACSVLRVVDDGPGISEAILPRVFDARVTTKAQGQGLGLATVKAIVDSHRGTIRLASTSKGTTFELAFPAAG